MRIIPNLTRMWLTRSVKPFTFKNEYDQRRHMQIAKIWGYMCIFRSAKSICNFCPYCKVRYSKELCDRYIDSLLQEIHLVGNQYPARNK